ncbi:MAG: HAD-IA family hydrolase [Rubrivivax sp.]
MKALLWDVDGTLAETERDGHRVAFNLAFAERGLPWTWSESHYGRLLSVTGGRERLLHDMATRADAPVPAAQREALAAELHARKNQLYAERVAAGAVQLRPGVAELIDEACSAGLQLAITTTTSRANVDALLTATLGRAWRSRFAAVLCGEDVARKKPDPEVYRRALQALALAPLDTLAIEDSPGGVAAARAAQVPVVVTRSAYFEHATLEDAIAIGPGLGSRRGWRPALPDHGEGRITLADLSRWRELAGSVSQIG